MRIIAVLWLGLFLAGCWKPVRESEIDAGVDAGRPDAAGVSDGGAPDAGFDGGPPDAGVDGGVPDGGNPDGGLPDGGAADGGGLDAGPADAGGNGIVVRGRTLGGPGTSGIQSLVAVGSNLYVIGSFSGSVDFGSGPVLSSPLNGRNGFIAKYDAALALLWVRSLPGPETSLAAITFDPSAGDLVIVGQFNSTVGLGDGGFVSAGHEDSFVARVSASGMVMSSVHLRPTDGGVVRAYGVASSQGKLAVVGVFRRPFSTDGGPEAPASIAQSPFASAFIAFYDSTLVPTGSPLIAEPFDAIRSCLATGVVADGVGDFYVLGAAISECSVGGKTLGVYPGGFGGTRWIWKVRGDTSTAWAESYGQKIALDDWEGLLLDGANLYLATTRSQWVEPWVQTSGVLSSDGGLIPRMDGGALFDDGGLDYNGIVIRAEAATGVASWAERPDFPEINSSRSVAISASGSLYTLGSSQTGSLLLTKMPGPPDPYLLANTIHAVYTSGLVRFGTMLAMTGYQNGPFTVGSVSMDAGPMSGGGAGFILLLAP